MGGLDVAALDDGRTTAESSIDVSDALASGRRRPF